MDTVAYRKFKKQVIERAGYECEIPDCNCSTDLTVHHMLKQSTFPQYKYEVKNGVCLCGKCHSKIESMLRGHEDIYPYLGRRLDEIHDFAKVTWKQLGLDRCENE